MPDFFLTIIIYISFNMQNGECRARILCNFFLGEIPRTIVAREEIFEFAATAPGD
jgi:hypothetical protein